jgi:dTDP-glucose pyrophosphorylase
MISLLPMAGRGSRFKIENYNLPKPFIPIMDIPMFMAAIQSFPAVDKHMIICQSDFVKRYSFKEQASKFLPNCEVLSVDEVTDGQVCTCLLAENFIDSEESLLISSCDYQVVYDETQYKLLLNDPDVDVIIWTFTAGGITKYDPSAFAYCREENGYVKEVVEKKTISDTPEKDPTVVGTFTYRRFGDFVTGAKSLIAKNIRVNNEFYVGTSINQLIESGKRVKIFPVKKFISFGNPFELQLYQYWEEFFYSDEKHLYKW